MAFSASQAALEGFRLVRRRPVSFIVWSLVPGAAIVALSLGGVWLFADQFSDVFSGAHVEPSRVAGLLGGLFIAFLAAFAVIMVYVSVIYCAIYRAVLKPAQSGLAYLRFGRDEWNMFLLLMLTAVAGAVVELVGVAIGVGIYATPLLNEAKFGLIALEAMALLGLLVFVLIRWCLAGPVIVAEGRLDLGRSWSLTRGRLWPLIGMLLLAGILGWLVSVAIEVVTRPLSFMLYNPYQLPPPSLSQAWTRMWSMIAANPGPTAAVSVLLMLAMTLQMVVQLAPVAAAYRDIVGESEA